MENEKFLTEQIITYIGNKRALLTFIGDAVDLIKKDLHKTKISAVDVFSGSGIVSRYLKQFCSELHTNDLEDYATTISKCYLTNKKDINLTLLNKYYKDVIVKVKNEKKEGFITKLYCPVDDNNIKQDERVFFKHSNGVYIDSCRQYIEEVPEPYKTLLLAPLLYEVSTKNNTSGVFKGFYKNSKTNCGQFGGNGKNALKRILGDIELKKPVLSNYSSKVKVHQVDANLLYKELPDLDLAYLDPPYNQHPYGSNYFMLNLVNNYVEPKEISKVSGIPVDWNKSSYNNKKSALQSLSNLCKKLPAKYVLISFSSEGFISYNEMVKMLSKLGNVKVFNHDYNVFRACRNLNEREHIHLKEYLFLLRKEG